MARSAFGITCGIGSLLVGARQAGFDIVGNLEWRDYYFHKDEHGRNTFTENFRGAPFKKHYRDLTHDEIQRMMGAELALGHPECGAYSQLSSANKGFRDRQQKDPSDIPLFCDLVAKFKPRFFVMDDLPRSLQAFPMSAYHEKLKDYDLFPEWISNWGYGNVQKNRNRMFMIGALRDEKWAFMPGEDDHGVTVRNLLEDLGEPRPGSNYPNHDPTDMAGISFRALNLGGYKKQNTWAEVRDYFMDKPGGFTLEYPRADGRIVKRIGFLKTHLNKHSHVLTGGNAILHPTRCTPFTIRERARIQGFPDDFVFYGARLNEAGEWNHEGPDQNIMVRQTGKAMPVQFAAYVSSQVMAHLEGRDFRSSNQRIMDNNSFVDEAKSWYCENVGYSNQERACANCWLYDECEIRSRLYSVGDPLPIRGKVKRRTEPQVQVKYEPPPPAPVVAPTPAPAPMRPRAKRVQSRSRRFAEMVETYDLQEDE